jgi:hypothetical protein
MKTLQRQEVTSADGHSVLWTVSCVVWKDILSFCIDWLAEDSIRRSQESSQNFLQIRGKPRNPVFGGRSQDLRDAIRFPPGNSAKKTPEVFLIVVQEFCSYNTKIPWWNFSMVKLEVYSENHANNELYS